jgi:hypothetical protein
MKPDSEVWHHLFFPCGFFKYFSSQSFQGYCMASLDFLQLRLQSKHNLEGVAEPQLIFQVIFVIMCCPGALLHYTLGTLQNVGQ